MPKFFTNLDWMQIFKRDALNTPDLSLKITTKFEWIIIEFYFVNNFRKKYILPPKFDNFFHFCL